MIRQLHLAIGGGPDPTFERDLAGCVTYADLVRLIRSRGVKVPMHTDPGDLPQEFRKYMFDIAFQREWIRSGRRVVRIDAFAVNKLETAPPADPADVPRIRADGVLIVEFETPIVPGPEWGVGATLPVVGVCLMPSNKDEVVGNYMIAGLDLNDGILLSDGVVPLVDPVSGDTAHIFDTLLWNLCAALADRRISHVVEFPRTSVEGRRARKRGVSLRRLVLADDLRGVWVTRKIGPPAVLTPAEHVERGPVSVHVCHAHTARRWVVDAPVERLELDAEGFTIQRRNAAGRVLYAARVPVREHVRGTGAKARIERVVGC